jgi:hypothetical protein
MSFNSLTAMVCWRCSGFGAREAADANVVEVGGGHQGVDGALKGFVGDLRGGDLADKVVFEVAFGVVLTSEARDGVVDWMDRCGCGLHRVEESFVSRIEDGTGAVVVCGRVTASG